MSSRIELDPVDRGTVEYLRRRLQQIEAMDTGGLTREELIGAWGRTLSVVDSLLELLDKGVGSGE